MGLAKCAAGSCPQAVAPHPMVAGTGVVTAFVVLRAFSSGSTALTGVEAIANGVNAFRKPHGKNAAQTMLVLGAIAIVMFLGVSWLAVQMHARPTDTGTPSVLSEVARGIFPSSSALGFMYWTVQALTLAVLVLAANTSYQGFPRLSALLARDRFFPTAVHEPRRPPGLLERDRRPGPRSRWRCSGSTTPSVNSLIHLYVIGVFTAFTLSQAGMVRYWWRGREPGWRHRIVVNAVGATATGVVTVVVIWTKFAEGAWLVIVAIPLLVLSFLGINRHYRRFARRLRAGVGAVRAARPPTNEVLLAVEAIDVATEGALWYARQVAATRPDPSAAHPGRAHRQGIRPRWFDFAQAEPKLEVLTCDEGRDARGARGGLEATARRVGLRDARRARAVPAALASLGRRPDVVPSQASAAGGARRRRHRRPSSLRVAEAGGQDAGASRRARPRRQHPRRLAARASTTPSRSASKTRGRCHSPWARTRRSVSRTSTPRRGSRCRST